MKKSRLLKIFSFIAMICCSIGAINLNNIAKAEEKSSVDSVFNENNIVLTAATITDPHIGYSGNDAKLENTLDILTKWAGANGIDMFISAGDNTQTGIKDEADTFMDILSSHYDLTKVPIVAAYGNHDVYWTGCMSRSAFYDAFNARGMYAFDKDMEGAKLGNRHVEVNGYHFLTVDIEKYGDNYNTLSATTETWLKAKLTTLSTENAGEPIFVISHSPAMNTIYGSILGEAEYGNITEDDATAIWGASVELDNILKDYPQVINISGHTHYANNHDLAIMQTTYTSFTPGGAADLAANPDTEETAKAVLPNSRSHSQGTLLQIDGDNNVRITRIDMVKDAQIREAWIIPAPKADNSHLEAYSYKRGETNAAPVFPQEDFKVSVEGTSIVKVTYPIASDDGLVYSYRITLKENNGDIIQSVTTLAPWIEYPDTTKMPDTLSYTFNGVGISDSCVVELTAIDCWGAETTVETTVQQETFDLLDGATFDSTADTKLVYDTATKTGSANAPSGEVSRYFSYATQDNVITADGVKPFVGMSAEYSVTYTNIGTLNVKADTNYLGVIFQVDGYQQKYRIGSALNYGGSDYLVKRADENSPFVVDGNKRNLKSVVVTEENPSATIVFKFTPKVGNVDGSFSIAVNGVSAGSYVYTSTSLPVMGLLVGKNSADISNASIKVLGATGWYEDYDLLSDSDWTHTLKSDGATAENKYSYDFVNKVGYIGGSASGVDVATGERATAYFDITAPDKLVASNGSLIDYSSLKTITVSMTFSDVVAADGTFDADNNNEFVAIRLLDNESKQQAAAFVMNKAKYGHFGVFERTNNEVFGSNFDTGNVRFGGSTSPWADGKLTISLKITLATETQAGKIEVILNGVAAQFNGKIDGTSTTIVEFSYEGKTIPKFGMYARGVCAKVSNIAYELQGVSEAHTHTEEILAEVAATCTTDGLTEGKKCSVCDMTLVAQETILAAHTTTKTEAVTPTCTQAGNVAYWTCSGVCGKTYSDEACTTEITDMVEPATGHNVTKTEAAAPTCEADGNIDFWFCNACSKIFSDETYETEVAGDQVLLPATGHTESDWIIDTEAQIGVAGRKHKECTVCGETLVMEDIPALEAPESSEQDTTSDSGNSSEVSDSEGDSSIVEESSSEENSSEGSKESTESTSDSSEEDVDSEPLEKDSGSSTKGCFGTISGLTLNIVWIGVAAVALLRKKED